MPGDPIGKIERIPLREVWKHEAHNFTKWLADHMDVLSEVIPPDLTLIEREAAAGSFSVDLVAEDSDGQTVIIENQLEKSDHDHLGKLLTYLSAYEASAAIWIVGEPRPEHTKAVAWLNDSTPADFFLLRAEAIKIGNSEPALLLTPIVGPSQEAKAVAKDKQEKSERHKLRKEFWSHLLETASTRTQLHASISPSDQNWISVSGGRTGLSFNYYCRQNDWRVELYIDTGDEDENKAIYDFIRRDQPRIDAQYAEPLEWQSLPEKRACRITSEWVSSGGYRSDPSKWSAFHGDMVDAMIRLEKALRPTLDTLPPTRLLVARTPAE
ncbi:MAG: DUF4268 domain-containing protein [Phycisphaerales bacterium JB037]